MTTISSALIVLAFATAASAQRSDLASPSAYNNNAGRSLKRNKKQPPQELCAIACAPYVRWDDGGKEKYYALVQDLVETCDVIVHVGDVKAGPEPCTDDSMSRALDYLTSEARKYGRTVLYSPGDNELNDCYRVAAKVEGGNVADQPPDVHITAADARAALAAKYGYRRKDLTGDHMIARHTMAGRSCDFDQYYSADNYAVVTLEVVGSHWYLDDERQRYPGQPAVDPADARIDMYENARDCAVEWIERTAQRAFEDDKRAVFFMLHAAFYEFSGLQAIGLSGIGPTWDGTDFFDRTGDKAPYYPLFGAFQKIAGKAEYKNMMFYIVHSDTHRSTTMRLFPNVTYPESYQNVMAHQTEGYLRGVTMYSRFTVSHDENVYQPVTVKEEWSKRAMETSPEGHTIRTW